MTSMQPNPNEQGSSKSDLFGIHLANMDVPSTEPHGVSFGSRLHAAREARGVDLETCAHTLKLPARVLRQLERDQYDDIDSKVYLGSYIGKYGRYLGINEASIQVEVDRIRQIEPPLVATGGISHSRFLLDRYATAATYVVLTAVIVVPMIWLGVRGTLDRDLSHLAPLDAAPVAQMDAPATGVAVNNGPSTQLAPVVPPKVMLPQAQDEPLMASMAPFPNLESGSLSPPNSNSAAVDAGTGGHSLTLSLSAASWVEVIGSGGARLEYGLLPAGSSKTYHSDQPLDVRIGNASGAQISIDGQPVGLDDFRHANVARFRVQMQDGKASAASL
ncbi:helix-turn-helix domain-containing protein [Rhodanobacter glycinis]|uniref:Helix-turn-helix domain-containing protein n=1 Tax=Rhodanobacter glycinis TaxID=582702 RepID=A0A502FM85_9GAMM|nr:RodZ domain-containing protein [Rhodanobacter glycinis]TPG04099.1 helix-turn-helix domain-containing protein [Rhodanobacter glycinis]TPG50638.1 helix-turn-helix domain-containing protein [Rhodanobacter glycinis]